jgi:hypothetical protein
VGRDAKGHEDEQHVQPRSGEDVSDRERNGALALPGVLLLSPRLGLCWRALPAAESVTFQDRILLRGVYGP